MCGALWPSCVLASHRFASPSGSARLQDDDGDLAVRRPLRVGVVVGPNLRRLLPEALPLLAVRHARSDVSHLAAHLHADVWVRFEVVVPGGVLLVAALRGDD